MAENSQKVGSVSVELRADATQLNAGLAEAQAKIGSFGDQAAATTTRAGGGFETLGKGIRRTIAPITQLIGSITASIGAFSVFLSLGERFGRLVTGLDENGQTKAEVGAAATQGAVQGAVRKAAGIKGDSAERAALVKRQAELDAEIAALEELSRSTLPSPFTSGIGSQGFTPQSLSPADEARLSQLRSERGAVSGAIQRLGEFESPSSGARAARTNQTFSGGGDAALRLLRQIELNSRRNAD